MKKKISAALLAFMLVFQVMTSGYMMPFTALAQESLTTQAAEDAEALTTSEETAKTQETLANNEALQNATKLVDDLFTDATHSTIKETTVDAVINTVEVQVNLVAEGEEKTALQKLITEARTQVVAQAQAEATKEEATVEENTTEAAQEEQASEATKEVATEVEKTEEQATEETKEVAKETPKKKALKTSADAGVEIKENIISNATLSVNKKVVTSGETIEATSNSFSAELSMTYELPDNKYSAESTFTFDLPKEMQMYSAIINEPLVGNPSYGYFNVTQNGKVTITFNEKIEDESGVVGTLNFSTKIEANKEQSNEQELVIKPFNEEKKFTFKVNYPKPTTGPANASKTGSFVGKFNQKLADWSVTMNAKNNQLTNGVIQDTIPVGMEYVNDSAKIYELELLMNGKLKETDVTEEMKSKLAYTEQVLTLSIGETKKGYKITYQTKVVGEYLGNYTNKALLLDSEQMVKDTEKTQTLTPSTGKVLEKKGTGLADDQKSIKWEIKFNGSAREYPKDTFLSDSLLSSYKDGTMKMFVANINESTGAMTSSNIQFEDFTVDTSTSKITFPKGVTTGLIIVYETNIPTDYKNGQTYQNTVSLNGSAEANYQVTGSYTMPKIGLTKKSTAPNYQTKVVNWTIDVTNDKKGYIASGSILKDTFTSEDLTLVDNSIEVKVDGEIYDSTNYSISDVDNKKGFTITFDREIKGAIEVTYQTKFAVSASKTTYSYGNGVTFDYTNQVNVTEKLKTDGVFTPNKATEDNGYKTGSYDEGTKRVTWTVGVNYNYAKLSNVTVKDTLKIEDGFTIDQSTFKVVNDKGNEIASNLYTKEIDTTGKSFEVKFLGDIEEPYKIIYETTDDDYIYSSSYNNTAVVSSGDDVLTTLSETVGAKDSSEKETNFNNYVEKTGSQNTATTPDYIDWVLTVNKAGSTIKNFKILDEPQGYQIFKEDTVSITNVKSGEILTKDTDYKVTYYKETGNFEIEFLKDISEAYVIKYQTLFLPEKNTGTIGNKVTASGSNLKIEKNDKESIVEYKHSNAWGTSSGRLFNLQLHKKTNDQSEKALAGIQFELYSDSTLKNLVDTATTDENGNLNFYRLLLSKDYYLVEKNIPTGYLENEKTKVSLTQLPADGMHKIEIINKAEVQAVQLKKKTTTGNNLAGVTFELLNDKDEKVEYNGKNEFITDENGEIYLGNIDKDDAHKMLPIGKYKFIETKTVTGYKLDETPIPFEITTGKSEAIQAEVTNEACKKTTIKVVDNEKPVENATVNIYEKNNNTVVETFTTNNQGKVELDAKYGTDAYKAEVIYGDRTATIKDLAQDGNCEVTVTIDLSCKYKTIFVKEDGEKLPNVIVVIYNANGDVINTKTTDAEGKVNFDPSDFETASKVTIDDGKREVKEITNVEFNDKCQMTVDIKDQACLQITVTVKYDVKLIQNAKVQILDKDGKVQSLNTADETVLKTDVNGEVTIPTKYANGDYEISIIANGYTFTPKTFEPTNCVLIVDLNNNDNNCKEYVISVLDENNKKLSDAQYDKFRTDSVFTLTSTDGSVEIKNVQIDEDGDLAIIDEDGKLVKVDKVMLNGADGEYVLTQTKTAAGFETIKPTTVVDLNNCTGTVTINFAKTTDPTTPGISCPDFTINYNGPASSQAEFKLVKVDTDATTGAKTETDVETAIKVVTDATTNKQKLDLQITALEAGDYKLVQTKAHPGYQTTSTTFTVKEGVCQAELTVSNSPTPPPVCERDTVIGITDTEGAKVVPNEQAVVTVDGKTVDFTVENDKVVIPQSEISKTQDSIVTITLEDGRTTTTTLSKDRVECTVDVEVPVLKLCTENPTISITTKDGKEVSTDLVEKVIVNGKETPVVTENGKIVIPKDSVNPKEDTIVTVTLKDGTEGTVTIPKFTEECTFTIVVNQACEKLTVNVTNDGQAVKSGTVEILDADGKVVATAKINSKGQATFEAKYANSKYKAKVTVGNKQQTVTVSVDEKCAMTVKLVKACEKATVTVTVNDKAQKDVTVKVVDSNGKTVQKVTTDKNGVAKVDPKYVNDKHKVVVTILEETKSYEFHDCAIYINVKPKVDVKDDKENGKTPNNTTDVETTTPTAVKGETITAENPNNSNHVNDAKGKDQAHDVSVPTADSPGELYNVYDEAGNIVGKDVIVDKNGKVNVKNLPAGKYKLISTDGKNTVEFTVDKDGKLPQTGTQDFLMYTLYGAVILAAGVWLLARNRKKNA